MQIWVHSGGCSKRWVNGELGKAASGGAGVWLRPWDRCGTRGTGVLWSFVPQPGLHSTLAHTHVGRSFAH